MKNGELQGVVSGAWFGSVVFTSINSFIRDDYRLMVSVMASPRRFYNTSRLLFFYVAVRSHN